jgi:hypothetical protein
VLVDTSAGTITKVSDSTLSATLLLPKKDEQNGTISVDTAGAIGPAVSESS